MGFFICQPPASPYDRAGGGPEEGSQFHPHRLTSGFNSVYEGRPESIQIKRRLAGLTPEPFRAGRSTTSPIYLLQNRHRLGFSRFAIWLRHFGSMLFGR